MDESPDDDVFDDVTQERCRSSAEPVELTEQQPAETTWNKLGIMPVFLQLMVLRKILRILMNFK